MVDMKKEPMITIWEDCIPAVADAIQQFEKCWRPYSAFSRRYPIIRLIEKIIDPAVTVYTSALPISYSGYIPGAGTGISFSAIIRILGFAAMVRMQRQLLRQFIKTQNINIARNKRFIATLETLSELVESCASKRPKKSSPEKGVNLNNQRKQGFCDFCGSLTELAVFMETVAAKQINDVELQDHQKLELSHQYCSGHRPKLTTGEWNPLYRKAKRSFQQFNIELARLNRQCAKRSTPQAASGDSLVDSYTYHYMLRQNLQPADIAELRDLARQIIDAKLTDRKKQILILQWGGLNQSEIARKLGIERQAVSKALKSLASTPRMLQLKE